jgi:hypothetical protein
MLTPHIPNIEAAILQSALQSEGLTEDELQEACAAVLHTSGLKTYREARYFSPARTGAAFSAVDVVATDCTNELWLEIKRVRDVAGLNRCKLGSSYQGITGRIAADLQKIAALPAAVDRWFLAVGYTDGQSTARMNEIDVALTATPFTAVVKAAHQVQGAATVKSLAEIRMWFCKL